MNRLRTFQKNILDRDLRPLREAIRGFVPRGSNVLEVGFGTGTLMLFLAPRIARGVALEANGDLAVYATQKAREHGITNVAFHRGGFDLVNADRFDIGILSLVLHTVEPKAARELLMKTASRCSELIIADFASPKIWIVLDEMISGHYLNYRSFVRRGGIPALLHESDIDPHIKFLVHLHHGMDIGLWVCRGAL